MQWFADYAALCGAMSPLGKISLLSDLAMAISYFAIPASFVIVLAKRGEDVSHPQLLRLFVTVFTACGLGHVVHALQMPWTQFEHTALEAAVDASTAAASLLTASWLIYLMPGIVRAVSPRQRSRELAKQVAERTEENGRLLKEINHRLGNTLQVIQSAIRIEKRRPHCLDSRETLNRLKSVVDDLGARYHDEEHKYVDVSKAA